MANTRMQQEDVRALLNLRGSLIADHTRLLDGASSPHTAMVKQSDVSRCLTNAIKSIEEILETAGGVQIKR